MRFSLSKVFITKFGFKLFNFFDKFFFVLKKSNRFNNFLYLVGIICFVWMCFNHVVTSFQLNLHVQNRDKYIIVKVFVSIIKCVINFQTVKA